MSQASLPTFDLSGTGRDIGRQHGEAARAQIKDGNVVLHADDVASPVAVRYGWANYPVVNLWNKAGLPASPFRTDNFPMITTPKKETQLKPDSEKKGAAGKIPKTAS